LGVLVFWLMQVFQTIIQPKQYFLCFSNPSAKQSKQGANQSKKSAEAKHQPKQGISQSKS